ncbi:MAG: hypothetical protein CMH49_06595 [Myxococcales bacterium]|nr:hypothetical protein [Myxococcales bacterium]
MLLNMCPYVDKYVSIFIYEYVLMFILICPYVHMHVSLCVSRCLYFCRSWNHDQDTTTTDTSDDDLVGGLGKFSHKEIGLSHQHWVEQVISAGSFGVHCTEAAEAMHKTCMKLSSQRVRHFRQNRTQKSMLDYLRRYTLFEELTKLHPPPPVQNARRRQDISVLLPLQCDSGYVLMGHDLQTVARQQQFLHPEVRLARVEILDMLCERLDLSKTRQTYSCMNRLQWTFGQKLVLPGSTYWATDTQYMCPTSESRSVEVCVLVYQSMFPYA